MKSLSISETIIGGLKFGMVLQFAIGPITILILQIAIFGGFFEGMMAVFGAFLADTLFVMLAILGIGAFIKQYPKQFTLLKWFGAVVMIIFGLSMVLSVFEVQLLPSIQLVDGSQLTTSLLKVFVLTIANPMTILFWTGVFATKIDDLTSPWLFGSGAVIATLFFQTFVVIAGVGLNLVVNDVILLVLNGLVGIVIIGFGIKLIITLLKPIGGEADEIY